MTTQNTVVTANPTMNTSAATAALKLAMVEGIMPSTINDQQVQEVVGLSADHLMDKVRRGVRYTEGQFNLILQLQEIRSRESANWDAYNKKESEGAISPEEYDCVRTALVAERSALCSITNPMEDAGIPASNYDWLWDLKNRYQNTFSIHSWVEACWLARRELETGIRPFHHERDGNEFLCRKGQWNDVSGWGMVSRSAQNGEKHASWAFVEHYIHVSRALGNQSSHIAAYFKEEAIAA